MMSWILDIVKGRVIKTNIQTCRCSHSFPNVFLWISPLAFVQLSEQRGVSYTRLQLCSVTTGGAAAAATISMLIGIIAGAGVKLNGGGSATLYRLHVKEANGSASVS